MVGTTPLYRRYRQSNGDHLYTTSKDEADRAIFAYGYVDEGITGFVATQEVAGTRPFRRFNHSKFGHLYTTEVGDAAVAVQQVGYVEEGLAGYIWTGPTSVTTDNRKGNKEEGTTGKGETEGGQNTGADSHPNWTAIAAAIAALLTALAAIIAALRRRDKN